ncbi:hypothetical protein LCGC14_2706690 [marine sediment metagenome]|uniref:Uncharacterized protein n=1 Tax=marine sediment metagenome TaxID=412755 RepID=A0A0F8ZE38_9ZZZZ
MPAVIRAYDHHGKVSVCDETCYTTDKPRRQCICRGLNTGVGFVQAVRNVTKHNAGLTQALHLKYPQIFFLIMSDTSCTSQKQRKRGSDSVQPET